MKFGAGDEIRTRDQELGKLLLYQLSYARSATVLSDFITPLQHG